MRSRFLLLPAVFAALAIGGCVASPADSEVDSAALHSVEAAEAGFYLRAPLSNPNVEALRTALEHASDDAWARNQGRTFGVAWEHGPGGPLDATQRTAILQAAFSFAVGEHRDLLRRLEVLHEGEELGKGLDAVGLFPDGPDARAADARARLDAALRRAAAEHGVTVLRATLSYEPDMAWEGALVVLDEANAQILVATGGYGT
jgi:hypothetical protein